MKVLGFAAFAAILITVPAHAEGILAYGSVCSGSLGINPIPGYSCSQGTTVSGTGLLVPSSNNRLGRVETANPNVDAIFLCRNYNSANNTSGLNGYILQNIVTGNTCFFDAKPNVSGTVAPPNGATASTFWRDPSNYADECQTCHTADPFIVSPGLASAMRTQGMMTRGRNLKGVYNIVNSDSSSSHFFNWNAERQISSLACASSCHLGSTTSTSQSYVTNAINNGWMDSGNYTTAFLPSTGPLARIGVWRPGATANFYLDADNNKSWSSVDKVGAFGTTGDRPYVLRSSDCAKGRVRTTFGTARGTSWMFTSNNHFWDSTDASNTFTYREGKPFSWNGVAGSFWNALFIIDYNYNKAISGDWSLSFGLTTDYPVIGRWVRGIAFRAAVFRAGSNGLGYWYLDTSGNNSWGAGDTEAQFGAATDIPVSGDFNGDGIDEIGVFRNGSWFIDMNNNFQWNGTAGGDAEWFFGQAGDIPVVSGDKWDCSW